MNVSIAHDRRYLRLITGIRKNLVVPSLSPSDETDAEASKGLTGA